MVQTHRRPPIEASRTDDARIARVLYRSLQYARRRDYRGPDFGDGLSALPTRVLPVDSKLLNLIVQETVKRAPVNVRPLLGVEYRRNYKGTALFLLANRNLERLTAGVRSVPLGNTDYRSEATALANWLVRNRSTGYSGFCGGFLHELQMLDGKHSPGDPDIVSTSYAVRALLAAGAYDESYASLARTAARFVVEDLNYRTVDGGDGAVIDYHTNNSGDHYTINAGALGARLFVDLYHHFGDEAYLERATKILNHVAALQTDLGGWPYRDPSDSSHLSMDNHHNGFIIESFQQYRALAEPSRYEETVSKALSFYRDILFDPDGAPNFDESSAYPRDVHASAQGILVFTYAGDLPFARRVIDWTIRNLYRGDGRFLYRKYFLHSKRVTLMRWCQAWMAYALSEFLRSRHPADTPPVHHDR